MDYTLKNNTEANRFEIQENGYTAFVEYKLQQDKLSLIHTEVPKELKGKGIGSYLAKNVLQYAQEHQLRVKPYCPFIKAYIDKHEEYQAISEFHSN